MTDRIAVAIQERGTDRYVVVTGGKTVGKILHDGPDKWLVLVEGPAYGTAEEAVAALLTLKQP